MNRIYEREKENGGGEHFTILRSPFTIQRSLSPSSPFLSTMRIFVYEHITGGGSCGRPLPPSLAREGQAMLHAISTDLAHLEDPLVRVTAVLDERVSLELPPGRVDTIRVSTVEKARSLFDELCATSDGTLIIAPELNGDLLRLARRVDEVGGRHLGSRPAAIEETADKLLLARHLTANGIRCIPTEDYSTGRASSFPFPLVLKPRHGAGSTDTFLIRDRDSFPEPVRESVLTPFTGGLAASVLTLKGPSERPDTSIAFPACEQLLSQDGRFRYHGGRCPLPRDLDSRARKLALATTNLLEGVRGFVGVDLLLGDPDTDGDWVVEVNPRLTTSYVGLRALSRSNLAAAWLSVVRGDLPLPPLTWHPGSVHFHPDGTVETESLEKTH